jgi:hypothetical protein
VLTDDEGDSLSALIFRTAATLRPPPTLPDSAMIHEVRGQLLFDSARTPADLENAAVEYFHALTIAPWVPRFYYNTALIAEQLGGTSNLRIAMRLMRQYLLSSETEDRDAARRKLIALELLLERAESAQATETARFAAIDEWVGSVPFYTKQITSSSILFGPCRLLQQHCAAIGYGRAYAGPDPGGWQQSGNADIHRRGDTLIIGPGAGVFYGVARGNPLVEELAWFQRRTNDPDERQCEGYEPSGEYPIHATVVSHTNGGRELWLTTVNQRPAMPRLREPCLLIESSQYMYAFVAPVRTSAQPQSGTSRIVADKNASTHVYRGLAGTRR